MYDISNRETFDALGYVALGSIASGSAISSLVSPLGPHFCITYGVVPQFLGDTGT